MRFISILGCLLLSVLLAACATSKGDKLMKAGQWEEAATAYQEDLREDAFNPDLEAKLAVARTRAAAVHAERGEAMLKERNLPGAIETMKHALTLSPTNAHYRAVLAEAQRGPFPIQRRRWKTERLIAIQNIAA